MAVVGRQFCAPNPVDLTVTKKAFIISSGNFTVTDVHGGIVFKVKGVVSSHRRRRILRDAAGNALLTFQKKMRSRYNRWRVFRGESTNPRDLLFSVKRTSIFQTMKTKLDVFLAANTKEEVCDFKVKGSYFDRSCTIHLGESDNIIAQMKRRYTLTNVLLGKDTFGVTVYPHVDYAFIVSLIVILDDINHGRGSVGSTNNP